MAVLTLALGIGASSTMFSLVDAVVVRPLRYPEPDRLVGVFLSDPREGGLARTSLSTVDFLAARDHVPELAHVAAISWAGYGLSVSGLGDQPERVDAASVTADFFSTLGVQPALGRGFAAGEDARGAPATVVVSHGFWRRRLGGDAAAVGRALVIEGVSHTIVGVMPADFRPPMRDAEIWPILQLAGRNARPPYWLTCIGRLAPGVTVGQATAGLARAFADVQARFPTSPYRGGIAVDLKELVVGPVRPVLVLLLGAVALLLVIAATNVANLALARGAARERELAIRASLGASRWRLIRQLLVENLLLAGIGGAVGVLASLWGVDALIGLAPASLPRAADVHVDARVLAFGASVSMLAGILFGLAPALQGTRRTPGDTLRATTSAAGGGRLRRALVVVEVALTVMLLVGAGLLARSFSRLRGVDGGFDARNVATMYVSLPESGYRDPAKITVLYDQLLARLENLPGVEAAGIGMSLPPHLLEMRNPFAVDGRPPQGAPPLAQELVISPGYLRALGAHLARGRWFDDTDRGDAMVVLVNQTLADRYFPGEDPVGKRLVTGDYDAKGPRETIVGVVSDVKYAGLDAATEPTLYVPFRAVWWPMFSRSMYLVVRSPLPAKSVADAVRGELAALDASLPIARVRTLDQLVGESVAPQRFRTLLLVLFAGAALVLAMVGLYGLLAHSVAQRTREVGVRMALGARAAAVVRLFVVQGLRLTLLGVAIGLVAAALLSRVLASLLFGVTTADVPSYLVAAAVALATALVACFVPARRASRVDPMVAMRAE